MKDLIKSLLFFSALVLFNSCTGLTYSYVPQRPNIYSPYWYSPHWNYGVRPYYYDHYGWGPINPYPRPYYRYTRPPSGRRPPLL